MFFATFILHLIHIFHLPPSEHLLLISHLISLFLHQLRGTTPLKQQSFHQGVIHVHYFYFPLCQVWQLITTRLTYLESFSLCRDVRLNTVPRCGPCSPPGVSSVEGRILSFIFS